MAGWCSGLDEGRRWSCREGIRSCMMFGFGRGKWQLWWKCWKWVWKNNNWATWGLIKSVTHTPKMSGPRTNAFSSARSVTWYIYLFKSIKYWMRKLTPKSPTSNGIFEETWYKLTINTLSHIESVRRMWRVYILIFSTMGRAPRGTPSL